MTIQGKIKFFLVIALFIGAAAFPLFYKVDRLAQAKTANLTAIPTEIGDWHMLDQKTNPSTSESGFLDDVLFRTYKRQDGKTISLAIAYGADQRQHFSIHVPEGCYRAAGFDVTSMGFAKVDMPGLELKKLLIKGEGRTEPMQYWIVLNGKVVTNHFERKIKQMYYSLFGARSGGVLIRVSSLSTDKDFQQDYEIQKAFISEMYKTLSPEIRRIIFGKETPV